MVHKIIETHKPIIVSEAAAIKINKEKKEKLKEIQKQFE
jgi:hypothetical protein